MNNLDALKNIRVVLSRTTHPGNIGAAARAMKTMGLESLWLVAPRYFPHADAEARAAHATDVLAAARVCTTLDEALAGVTYAVACSARPRDLSLEAADARQAAARVLAVAQAHPAAVVFGNEASGLTTDEVGRCQLIVHVPANPEYPSLNLAAAVQVLAYELRMGALDGAAAPPRDCGGEPARLEDVERLYVHLEKTLHDIGYTDPQRPKKLMQRLRRLFARSRLEREEVNILRGILGSVDALRRKQ
ncbi:MAG TPA: RNA methyltransferase [Burkholderiales bacterium]|nr:RNA methyltransferase [Burkholderiales bacterium]